MPKKGNSRTIGRRNRHHNQEFTGRSDAPVRSQYSSDTNFHLVDARRPIESVQHLPGIQRPMFDPDDVAPADRIGVAVGMNIEADHLKRTVRGIEDQIAGLKQQKLPVKRATLAEDLLAWCTRPMVSGVPVEFDRIGKLLLGTTGWSDDAGKVRDYAMRTRTSLLRAERVVLEDDFVRQAYRQSIPIGFSNRGNSTLRPYTRHIDRLLPLARAPFRDIWLEWNIRVQLNTAVEMGHLEAVAEDAPIRMGALIHSDETNARWTASCYSWTEGHGVAPHLLCYHVDTESPVSTAPIIHGGIYVDTVESRRASLIGSHDPRLSDSLDSWTAPQHVSIRAEFGSVAAHVTVVMAVGGDGRVLFQRAIRSAFIEQAGDLRFILTVLALINLTQVQYVYQPAAPGRMLVGGKSLPNIGHRTVRIEVPAGVRVRTRYLDRLIREAQHRRAHGVRGHWRREHTRKGKAIPGSWVRDHVRGDPNLGWIEQEHVVTT